MTDSLTTEERSRHMARVKNKNTRPEMIVRSTLHRLGYRFRLHDKNLPGKPDLVFAGRKKVLFVHGCLWHGHDCRGEGYAPRSNVEFWLHKIQQNKLRDEKVVASLRQLGWGVETVWECELKREAKWLVRIQKFLDGNV